MKRNHIYIGGTVLLAVLGAAGGYFLFSGGDDDVSPQQSKAGQQPGKQATDDDILPIDVPPMMAGDAGGIPVAGDPAERPPRYATNISAVDDGSAYDGVPFAGGVSALPAAAGNTPITGPVNASATSCWMSDAGSAMCVPT